MLNCCHNLQQRQQLWMAALISWLTCTTSVWPLNCCSQRWVHSSLRKLVTWSSLSFFSFGKLLPCPPMRSPARCTAHPRLWRVWLALPSGCRHVKPREDIWQLSSRRQGVKNHHYLSELFPKLTTFCPELNWRRRAHDCAVFLQVVQRKVVWLIDMSIVATIIEAGQDCLPTHTSHNRMFAYL